MKKSWNSLVAWQLRIQNCHCCSLGSIPTLETSMWHKCSQKKKFENRITIWSSYSTSKYLPKNSETLNQKIHAHLCSSQHYLQQPKHRNNLIKHLSVDEWIKNMWYICDRLLSHKKRWNLAICDNPEGVILSKISQTEKDKYYMISLVCGI